MNTATRRFCRALGTAPAALLLFVSLVCGQAFAAPHSVQIVGAGSNMLNVVQANPLGDPSRALSLGRAINDNMALLPFIAVISPSGIPGGAEVPSAKGEGVDFKRFAMANAHMLITANWLDASQVELRCFDVTTGRFMFGNRYAVGSGEEGVLDVADKFCGDFLEAVIGRGDFFRSRIAFSKSGGAKKKDLWSVQPNGRRLTQLTNMKGEALSPAWSPDGSRIIFTHLDKRSHGLGIVGAGGSGGQRVKFPGNMVIGPTFFPDGRIAVSLSDGSNPSIFSLGHSYQRGSKLDSSSGIDVSPSIDGSGSLMAFTSSRLGNPHIFLKDFRNGSVRRISQGGNYNTDPSISPDGTSVAFARREGGGHRIFVHDLMSGQERQVTFGPGSDEEPSFAPDGFFIVFMSTRNGQKQLYLTTRNGGEARRLPTGSGDAAFPAWGPATR